MGPRLHVPENASDESKRLKIIRDLIAFKKTLIVLADEYKRHNPALGLLREIDVTRAPEDHALKVTDSDKKLGLCYCIKKREPQYNAIVYLSQKPATLSGCLQLVETAILFINIDTDEEPEELETFRERRDIIGINKEHILFAVMHHPEAAIKFLHSNLVTFCFFTPMDLLDIYKHHHKDHYFIQSLYQKDSLLNKDIRLYLLLKELKEEVEKRVYDDYFEYVMHNRTLANLYCFQLISHLAADSRASAVSLLDIYMQHATNKVFTTYLRQQDHIINQNIKLSTLVARLKEEEESETYNRYAMQIAHNNAFALLYLQQTKHAIRLIAHPANVSSTVTFSQSPAVIFPAAGPPPAQLASANLNPIGLAPSEKRKPKSHKI